MKLFVIYGRAIWWRGTGWGDHKAGFPLTPRTSASNPASKLRAMTGMEYDPGGPMDELEW